MRQGADAYARGEYAQALARYEAAVRVSSASALPWLNGGAVWDEAGRPGQAALWYGRAVQLDPLDDEALCALGWAQLRGRDAAEAAATFRRVLQHDPDHAWAKLGLARAELALSRPKQAVTLLTRTPATGPTSNLDALFLGRAYEALGDRSNAIEAYRKGVGSDSYFVEARQALGRLYLRARRFNEAFRQFARALEADPHNPEYAALLAKVQPLLSAEGARREIVRSPLAAAAPSRAFPKGVPVLRIGVGTTPLGRPRARRSVAFSATTDFDLTDVKTGKRLASARADQFWTARLKRVRRRLALEVADESGRVRFLRSEPFLVTPRSRERGLVALNLVGAGQAAAASAEKILRGQVELAVWRRSLRIVNRLDLEDYTHGVVSAEMPIRSPLEALKAQAVTARTHALYIKLVSRRHRKDGYDVCDEQHCQVYAGARAESERSRAVVEATRGIIVTYRGRPAHVIYSSNCGGRTQDGSGLTGWGSVPYWTGISDCPVAEGPPDSPWALRRWLTSSPQAYCAPSNFVHPSHFRWTRTVAWPEFSRRIDRRYRIGRLKRIRTLRRAASGNINALLLEGTRRRVKVDSEMAIRGLPGLGSLRSTLFLFTPELGADGRPEAVTFTGGGWGHAVGMCQSGAMGRAEAGQDFPQIILSYYPGTALGRSDYAAADDALLP
ncbi:MAG: SpoIID/LytB domain-containing protein [Elusimicrobia bacterium]|nr:SpoIID/LytB domain-containing protein [Elusimicrobiota bacterium]